jgi:adenylylsulfate kinase
MVKSWTVWFVGLHGSGKTTITNNLAKLLKDIQVEVLDGDELRKTLSSDLTYTLEDRNIHMRRVADLCRKINEKGTLCIACVASPTEISREYARKVIENVVVVYAKCPIEVCEKRDVKGHYKKARNREKGFENFLGVSLQFEEPKDADLVLETDKESVDESVDKLIGFLKNRGMLVF